MFFWLFLSLASWLRVMSSCIYACWVGKSGSKIRHDLSACEGANYCLFFRTSVSTSFFQVFSEFIFVTFGQKDFSWLINRIETLPSHLREFTHQTNLFHHDLFGFDWHTFLNDFFSCCCWSCSFCSWLPREILSDTISFVHDIFIFLHWPLYRTLVVLRMAWLSIHLRRSWIIFFHRCTCTVMQIFLHLFCKKGRSLKLELWVYWSNIFFFRLSSVWDWLLWVFL